MEVEKQEDGKVILELDSVEVARKLAQLFAAEGERNQISALGLTFYKPVDDEKYLDRMNRAEFFSNLSQMLFRAAGIEKSS